MMAGSIVALFTLFALFCAGQFVRALIVPFIIIATLAYVLFLTGLFGGNVDAGKSRHPGSQRVVTP